MDIVKARWFTPGSSSRQKQLIILHDMETPLLSGTALGVAHYFANLPSTNKASAHICVDQNTEIRCVHDDDIAYAAPGANAIGLHLEMPGYAKYLRGEWSTDQMMAMLRRAVPIVRNWCDQYGIPKKFINSDVLAKHASGASRPMADRGITTHFEVGRAWRMTNHTDPGKGFPIDWFIDAVNQSGATPSAPPTTPQQQEDDDMPPYLEISCPTGGFWLVRKSDGGVFAYNDEGKTDGPGVAPFFGSMSGRPMAAPVVNMAPCVKNGAVVGYWLVGADGGVFNFGAAPLTDTYVAHPEWHQGNRDVVGIEQHDPGYDIITVETGSLPPVIDRYDLSEKR